MLKKLEIPVILVSEDTFTTATKINNAIFKIWPEDKPKIKETEELVEKYVDIDRVFKLIK